MMAKFFTFGLLGTSLSHGATRDHSYAREVAAALSAEKQSEIRCFNMSIDGGGSNTGLGVYESVARLRPNAIIFEYQANDCVETLTISENRHTAMIAGIRSISPTTKIFLMTMNPLLGSAAVVVARAALPSFHQLYRDLAVSLGVGLIDNVPAWAGSTLTDIPDGLHPTIVAHRARTVPNVVAALASLVT